MNYVTKYLLYTYFVQPICPQFGGSSGPPPVAVPVKPPAPLFPGAANAIASNAPGAIDTATKAFSDAASGVDVDKIYASITAAADRQGKEGRANIMSAMGATGMAGSSDAMRSTADFELQYQANLLSQLEKMQFENEAVKMGGAQGLMETYGNAGMAFAPTEVVAGQSGGPSIFSQATGAATGAATAIAMLMMACWVAAELYGGWDSLETRNVRCYLLTREGRLARWFVRLYTKYGQRVAVYIQTHKRTRKAVKVLFDWLVSKTFTWRTSCRSQA